MIMSVLNALCFGRLKFFCLLFVNLTDAVVELVQLFLVLCHGFLVLLSGFDDRFFLFFRCILKRLRGASGLGFYSFLCMVLHCFLQVCLGFAYAFDVGTCDIRHQFMLLSL